MTPAVIAGPGIRFMVNQATGVKIPAIAARGLVFTPWVPSPEEIEALEAGQPLWLIQRGTYIPEMSMMVGHQEMVVPRDLQLEALEDCSPDNQRMIEELQERKAAIEAKASRRVVIIGVIVALLAGAGIANIIRRLLGF